MNYSSASTYFNRTDFKVVIPQAVYDKVMYWVNAAVDYEVSGFGRVVKKGNEFHILDAYLLEQNGTAAHTEIDESSFNRLAFKTHEEEGQLRWWWHSHVQMNAFFSTMDDNTIKEFGANGWLLATVFNQKYEYRSAIAWREETTASRKITPWETTETEGKVETVYHDNIGTTIYREHDMDAMNTWKQEFVSKVKKREVTQVTPPLVSEHWSKSIGIAENRPSLYTPNYREDDGIKDIIDSDIGIKGYGIRAEAREIGISPREYVEHLYYSNDNQRLTEYERILDEAEFLGKFAGEAKLCQI